jgi:hypothetical protein
MVSVRLGFIAAACVFAACGSDRIGGTGTAAYVVDGRLVIVDVDSGGRQSVDLPFDRATELAIAPDGHAVAVASPSELYVIDLDGELELRQIARPPSSSPELRWGPGYLLFDSSNGVGDVGTRVVLDGEARSRELRDQVSPVPILQSPFDDSIAYVDGELLVVESATGARRVELASGGSPEPVAFLPDGELLISQWVDEQRTVQRRSVSDGSGSTIATGVSPEVGASAIDPAATTLLLRGNRTVGTLSLADGSVTELFDGPGFAIRSQFLATGAIAFDVSDDVDSRVEFHVVGDHDIVLDALADVTCLAHPSPSGRFIAWGCAGQPLIYSLDDGSVRSDLPFARFESFDRDDRGVVYGRLGEPGTWALEYMTLDGETTEIGVGSSVDYVP